MRKSISGAIASLLALASFSYAQQDLPHKVHLSESGFEAFNPEQNWTTRFDGTGSLTQPESAGWEWGLTLRNYDLGSKTAALKPTCEFADAGKFTYRWSDALEEWYVNDERGLEHGFTVYATDGKTDRLRFELEVRGSLTPVLQTSRRDVQFVTAGGIVAMTYTGLVAFDATGRDLAAHLAVESDALVLQVECSDAVFPITIDPVAQQAYVKASNTGSFDLFGWSSAMSPNVMVIGAPSEDSSANTVNGDESDNSLSAAGAAYVYERAGSSWNQTAYLKASNAGDTNFFGVAVAVSEDRIVVGARLEDSDSTGVNGSEVNAGADNSGAAYVFTRSGTDWVQEAYLKASNTDAGDLFGATVDIAGDTIIVGAPLEDSFSRIINQGQFDNSAINTGAAYVYQYNGTEWIFQAYLKAENADARDWFGTSVAIHGDRALVGAIREDGIFDNNPADNTGPNTGAVYVFTRTGAIWTQEDYLKPIGPGRNDFFGTSLDIDGDTLVIGANGEASNANGVNGNPHDNSLFNSGAAYVFVRTASDWVQQAYLKDDTNSFQFVGDKFGESVAISGDRVVVGALEDGTLGQGVDANPRRPNTPGNSVGAAYVFTRTGTDWEATAYLKAFNSGLLDQFGRSVAISGSSLVVGACCESSFATGVGGDPLNNFSLRSGAAYVFDVASPIPAGSPGTNHCNGDRGDQMGCTECPCSNHSVQGTIGGCLNSVGGASRLSVTGSPSVSTPYGDYNDLRFALADAPPTALTILLSGESVAPANMANPCFGLNSGVQSSGSDGLRCAILNATRHGTRVVDSFGEIGRVFDAWGGEASPLAGIPDSAMFASGTTRYFQAIHRDEPLLVCNRGMNGSQAIEITFTP